MTRLVRLALITSVASRVAAPAFAQSGPSFECAKASNDVERTICKDPELAKADREMAAAYAALAAKLSGAAKENLEKEQVRWLGDRNRGCAADTDGIVALPEETLRRAHDESASVGRGHLSLHQRAVALQERQARQDHLLLRHQLSEVRGHDRRLHRRQCALRQCREEGRRRRHAAGRFRARPRAGMDLRAELQDLSAERQRRHRRGGFLRLQRRRARLRRHRLHPGRSAHGQDRGPGRRVRGGRQVAAKPWSRSSAPTSRSSSSTSPASTKRWSPPASPSSCASPAATAGTPTGWR